MTAWDAYVANQRKLVSHDACPKLVNIDLRRYQTVQACERADIMNTGVLRDSEFHVISAFLTDHSHHFVAEVGGIDLKTRIERQSTVPRQPLLPLKTHLLLHSRNPSRGNRKNFWGVILVKQSQQR